MAAQLYALVHRLKYRWISARQLPCQPVHGDINIDNVGVAADGAPAYLDFGLSARRPRVYDVAYTLAQTVFTGGSGRAVDPQSVSWEQLRGLIDCYNRAVGRPLAPDERRAIVPYAVATLLCYPAGVWLGDNPGAQLRQMRPFQQFSAWLLDHPETLDDIE